MGCAWNVPSVPTTVFVNDIGNQFLIRIGARDSFERVAATQIWVVTLYRGDKDVSNGTIPFPEQLLEITAVYFEVALEGHHLSRE